MEPTEYSESGRRSPGRRLGEYDSESLRLTICILLTGIFFFVECIGGYIIHSLSLLTDSFHMLTDVTALIIALYSRRLSLRPPSKRYTYGWKRADSVGCLVNTVMLLTLAFTVVGDSLERLYNPECILRPISVIVIGVVGLVINFLVLLILKGEHGHSHADGGGGGVGRDGRQSTLSGEHVAQPDNNLLAEESISRKGSLKQASAGQPDNANHAYYLVTHAMAQLKFSEQDDLDDEGNLEELSLSSVEVAAPEGSTFMSVGGAGSISIRHNTTRAQSESIQGAALHVMADLTGSIIVIITGAILAFVPGDVDQHCVGGGRWKRFVDPCLSLCLVVLICIGALPLAIRMVRTLLQSVPKEISVENLTNELLALDYISGLHDLHVWRLKSDIIIGTVHVLCSNINAYNHIVSAVQKTFRKHKIFCVTIQPEFDIQCENEAECCENKLDKY